MKNVLFSTVAFLVGNVDQIVNGLESVVQIMMEVSHYRCLCLQLFNISFVVVAITNRCTLLSSICSHGLATVP